MASSSVSNLLLFSLLCLTFCNPCFSSQSPSHEKVSSESAPAQKVSLSVFYDSFSVESAEFILVNLSKIHETGLSEIVDLHLVPFGSAVLLKNGTITCRISGNFAWITNMRSLLLAIHLLSIISYFLI
ncbi:hypothetical protein MKX03_013394 [Papaver bracteatum]|nr:hypothetical protein MKX03_013394 [Papaver bracteatum]